MKRFIIPVIALMAMTSCEDFLNQEPQDFGSEEAFYKTDSDLEIAVNAFYTNLPTNNQFWGGLYTQDVNSDNQASTGVSSLLYKGEKRTPAMDSSQPWWFRDIRGINFFIQKVDGNENISGNKELVDHYLGEAFFFRAYTNFNRYVSLGDIPLLKEVQENDPNKLAANSRRQPRNVVARDIIADLDRAAELLKEDAPQSGRICRDAALLLKSRVALFEATWLKYHANTCFVPGNDKWPGHEFWPDFQWEAGSADAEINWFFEQAIKAADEVASHRTLDTDYLAMFNNTGEFSNTDEVILARYYRNGTITHSCSALLKSGGGCNATRALVNSYVMLNGLPIYAQNSGYKGDKTSYEELQDRDMRLQLSVRAAGSFITGKEVDGKYLPDTIYYYKPFIYASGSEKATTGYELNKWVSDDPVQRKQYQTTTAVPIYRAAEAYLNYIEAYYERYGNLGGNCDKYWRALRKRAGVDEDYNKTIAATELSKENDLAVWSRGKEVSPTLYNIRRERRCEFIAEGLRLNDLKRWRSLDMMVNYQIEGMNLWGGPVHEMYSSKELQQGIVSQASDGDYIMPLRLNATSPTFSGLNFPKQHYLEPIPVSEFSLVNIDDKNIILYQNPGWPDESDGIADYSFDCD